jgi:hypothetical protein
MSSAEPNKDSFPVVSMTRPGAALAISDASCASSLAPMTTIVDGGDSSRASSA